MRMWMLMKSLVYETIPHYVRKVRFCLYYSGGVFDSFCIHSFMLSRLGR